MAKISFNKLNLKKDTTINVIKIGDVEIEVKNYLPIEEKMSLIDLVVQESMEYGFVNPLKLEKYEKFQNSFYGMATKIVNSVPENMAEAMNMLDNLDLDKIAKTMKVAQLNAGNENALEVLVNGQNK